LKTKVIENNTAMKRKSTWYFYVE